MKYLIKYNIVLILTLFVFGSLFSQSIESRLILKEGIILIKKVIIKTLVIVILIQLKKIIII